MSVLNHFRIERTDNDYSKNLMYSIDEEGENSYIPQNLEEYFSKENKPFAIRMIGIDGN